MQRWIAQINSAIPAAHSVAPVRVVVRAESTLNELPQLERAVAVASVALCEGTPVVALDQLDAFANEEDEAAFLEAVSALAPATTTLVIGWPAAARSALPTAGVDRKVATVEFTSLDATLDAKGALQ